MMLIIPVNKLTPINPKTQLVPSQEQERIVGMVPKGQDGPIWFEYVFPLQSIIPK
jgi:hypothetical protein